MPGQGGWEQYLYLEPNLGQNIGTLTIFTKFHTFFKILTSKLPKNAIKNINSGGWVASNCKIFGTGSVDVGNEIRVI